MQPQQYGAVAQLVEQKTENLCVGGSIPSHTTNKKRLTLMVGLNFMGRILAVDYGTKRCGIAVTDPLQLIANTLCTIETKKIQPFLKEYMAREPVDTIVVGKPLQLDGSETHSSQHIEKFVLSLRQLYPLINIEQVDERFTSAIAQRALLEMGLKKKDRQKKEHIDQVSATIILQTYMEMKNGL